MSELNKHRQTKEYKLSDQGGYYTVPYKGADPVQQVMAQQIDEEMEECPLDPVEEAKILIVDKITRHLSDVIFEKVCNEMGNHYVFQSQNYLTEAGYELFEDEWFEFYHDHHGDILYEVMQNIESNY